MNLQRFCVGCCYLAIAIGITRPDLLAAEETTADAAADEALLESLDAELLEGLETVADESKPEATADESASDDEFTRIANRMRQVAKQITATDTAAQTQTAQREIVSELEKLIHELEQQCQKCSGQSSGSKSQSGQPSQRSQVKPANSQQAGEGNPSNQPARDSSEQLRPDELQRPDPKQMQSLLKDLWGQLPDKAREQMLQTSPEQFLPKYELMIEQYFKRLAKEQPAP